MPSSLSRRAFAALIIAACPAVAADPDGAVRGAREFMANCAGCHGKTGRGDGPIRSKLARPPSDLTTLSRDNGGSFPETLVYQIIDGRRFVPSHDARQMPVWGLRFRLEGDSEAWVETRIDDLIRFLEGIQTTSIE